uniref:EF-hand domain-containing protein n=1 Tax=Globisporangium ultimum (strain ATCC 200006 / CBS 805.95 / DAOM BR144) TaxID=431595 RepID=K3WVB1_GLOUD
MRLLRRTYTNLRTRRRSSVAAPLASSSSYGFKKPHPSSSSRKDAVSAVVKQFHVLTLDQRVRAVNRVMQLTNRKQLDDKFVEHFFLEADKDKDGLLNKHEFRAFLASRFSLKVFQASDTNQSVARPTNEQLKLVMIASAIPFVGFGFVDNIIMLAAGDMIEDHFHAAYHISMLCAAALGNTVSDVVGLSLGGIIETFARKIGIPDPQLSKAQANMSITHWCNFLASAGGITLGCLLGMFPLLFMNHSDECEDGDKKSAKQDGASDMMRQTTQSSETAPAALA